jgi:hypothetical protein
MRLLTGYEMTSNIQTYIVKTAKICVAVRFTKYAMAWLCNYTAMLQSVSEKMRLTKGEERLACRE